MPKTQKSTMQDWRERGGGSGESVFHSERRGGRGAGGVHGVQPMKPKPKSVTFGENRISVFLRDPTTIAQASQQGRYSVLLSINA